MSMVKKNCKGLNLKIISSLLFHQFSFTEHSTQLGIGRLKHLRLNYVCILFCEIANAIFRFPSSFNLLFSLPFS